MQGCRMCYRIWKWKAARWKGGDQPRGLQNNSMSEQDKKNVNKAKSHLIMSKEAKRKREAWDWQALRAQQMNGS
jgi:hypothetical protein